MSRVFKKIFKKSPKPPREHVSSVTPVVAAGSSNPQAERDIGPKGEQSRSNQDLD